MSKKLRSNTIKALVTEAAIHRCSSKQVLLKICHIHRKTRVLESPTQFPVNNVKLLRTPFFAGHVRWLRL